MTVPQPPAAEGPAAPRYDTATSGRWGPRLLAAFVTLLVIALVLAVLMTLWNRYTSAGVTGSVLGFTVTSDSAVEVRVKVVKQPGSRAYCIVRSRAADGSEIARDVLAVDDVGTPTRTARAEITLRTSARAVTGEVQGCSPEPIDKDPAHVQDANHPPLR